MKPVFFKSSDEFRTWLDRNHESAAELLVGFVKKKTGTSGITWPEAVDQALCFGWIDGVRRSLGEERYTIRFTPRKAGSRWSAVNIERVSTLKADGLMAPAGLKAFQARSAAKSRTYSYEQAKEARLDTALGRTFKADSKAWTFFNDQAPSYRRKIIHWVMTAKSSDVKLRRLHQAMAAFTKAKRL